MCDGTLDHTLSRHIVLWGQKAAPMGKGDTKPQLLRGGHFQEGAQGGKEVVSESSIIFRFLAFIFIHFNNKVFQNTSRSWCRQHCHCYKHWQISAQ